MSAVGISRSPLREWHAFATVSTPGRPGYRLLVSRAGDWTSRFIDDPPSALWVRGVPTRAPMAAIEVMYRRVVYVVTGSGIGPMLGQILSPRVPGRLVWSTRSPRATYGDALVDEVLAARPDAVIWDTTEPPPPSWTAWPPPSAPAVDSYAGRAGRVPPSPHRGQPGEGLVGPLLRHLEQPEFVRARQQPRVPGLAPPSVLPRRAVGQAVRAHGYPWLPAVTADDAAESAPGLSVGLQPSDQQRSLDRLPRLSRLGRRVR